MNSLKKECKKVCYSSEYFAIWDVDRIKKRSKHKLVPIRAYLCQCGAWHTTSKKPWIKKADSVGAMSL